MALAIRKSKTIGFYGGLMVGRIQELNMKIAELK
jgi:hypothetical protein